MIPTLAPIPPYVVPTTMIDVIRHLGAESLLRVCYDAGDENSWPGSGQYWKDVSGNGVDAINGTSVGDANRDFAFNGVVGRQSSGESWRNNTASFRIPLQSWMHAFHKNDAQLSIAGWAKGSNKGTYAFNTIDAGGLDGGPAGPGVGFSAGTGASGSTLYAPTFNAFNDSFSVIGAISSTLIPPSGSWLFTALSFNETSGAWTVQLNGTQQSGTTTYSSPSSSDATKNGEIYVTSSGTGGTLEVNTVAIWSRALAAADLMSIYEATRTKFGL